MITTFQTVKSFAQFIGKHIANGGKLVDQNTANLRAMICAQCHNNKSSKEVTGKECTTCQKGAKTILGGIRATIIGSNKTEFDRKLLTCGICGCDLKIKVWIPNEALITNEDANAYPSFCWLKKILEGKDL